MATPPPLEALLARRFATRQEAFSALSIHEFTTNDAALVGKGELTGGKKGVYGCASPGCTLEYWVTESETDGGYWHIRPPFGRHTLCLPTKKRALRLRDVMRLPAVAAQLVIQNNRLEPNQVPSSSIIQAAAGHKITLSAADVSRIQAMNTVELTDIALDGYEKIAWYCAELVRLNPGTKAFLQVRCVATGRITEHIYSTSTTPPYSVTVSFPLPVSSRLQLHSCIIIPASTYEIVKFCRTSIYSDFAHMYRFEHFEKSVYKRTSLFLMGNDEGLRRSQLLLRKNGRIRGVEVIVQILKALNQRSPTRRSGHDGMMSSGLHVRLRKYS